MQDETRGPNARGEQATGDLARLLDAEVRFADVVAEAVVDSERWIAEARGAAEAEQQTFFDSRDAEIERLDTLIAEEMRARVARLEEDARNRMGAWSSLQPADIDSLAARIAGRLLDPDARSTERGAAARAERTR